MRVERAARHHGSAPLTRRDWLAYAASAALGNGALELAGCEPETQARPGQRLVSFWYSYGGQNRIALEKLVHRFNASQEQVFVHPVFQGDYYEGIAKLRLGIAAQKPPALTHVIGEVVPYLVEAGVLQRLDSFATAYPNDLVPALGQKLAFSYPSAFASRSNEPFTLPFNRSTPIAYLNANLFDRFALAPPRTWDELRRVAQFFARQKPDGIRYGFGCEISWWFWIALVNQAGGELVDTDNRITLGGAAGVSAIRFWQTLVNHDRTMKPPPGRDANATEVINQDFLSGRIPLIWTSTAFLKYFEDNAAFRVKTAPLPKEQRHATPTGGTYFVMPRSNDDAVKEAAWTFLTWMMQPEQVAEWSTNTGYLPTTLSAVELLERRGFYRENPNYRVAYDQLSVATPLPWSPELFRVQREVIQPRLEQAVLAGLDAETIMAEALRESRG